MGYKDTFLAVYHFTHIAPRKGKRSLAEFQRRADYFQKTWGKLIPRDTNANIIDIGCGDGNLVWWLHQCGYAKAEGIDMSADQIEAAQALGVPNVRQADLRAYLADKADSYDAITLRDVLEHFTKQEITETFPLYYKALRKNGRIIIQVPNAASPLFGRIRYGDFTHELAFCESSLQQLLRVMGFGDTKCHPTYAAPPIRGVKSLIRFISWKLVEAFYQFLIFGETGCRRSIVTESIIAVAVKDEGSAT